MAKPKREDEDKRQTDTDKVRSDDGAAPGVTRPSDDRVADLEQQLLRIRADFENHKRRTAEERFRIAAVAQTDIVLQLLPVIDNFERAVKDVPKEVASSNWYEGIEAIRKQFSAFLDQLGIERIATVGQQFNPELHEAISHEPSSKYGENVVSEEFEAGYRLGEQVIRHSKVKVSSGKEKG
jgi:molecular chaperone GrpE